MAAVRMGPTAGGEVISIRSIRLPHIFSIAATPSQLVAPRPRPMRPAHLYFLLPCHSTGIGVSIYALVSTQTPISTYRAGVDVRLLTLREHEKRLDLRQAKQVAFEVILTPLNGSRRRQQKRYKLKYQHYP